MVDSLGERRLAPVLFAFEMSGEMSLRVTAEWMGGICSNFATDRYDAVAHARVGIRVEVTVEVNCTVGVTVRSFDVFDMLI